MESSDEELIQQYLDGQQKALKSLIDRYTPILYNYTLRFVGTTNTPDVVQEVFIKVWKNINKFDVSKSHFKTWIFTITRNTVTDYLRKKKQILFTDLDKEGEDPFSTNLTDEAILPDEAIQKLQDKELLTKLVSGLSPTYQEVLMLYYQEDMTFDEIGKILKKPLNTVKSHHRRALEQLRKMVL
jgi:RNA polymerase sigma-70 factor (ECF subfamily)